MPQFPTPTLKRSEIVAIDFGYQVTKAVHLRRRETGISLVKYVLVETPIYEKIPSRELLVDHFKQVVSALGVSGKHVVLAIGAADSFLSHVELPASSASELRKMIKLSPKTFLQQDLPDFLFDCFVKTPPGESAAGNTARTRRKAKVLVGGAKRRLVEHFQEAARDAGLIVEEITINQIGAVNAVAALPTDSHADVAALLDIGSNNSTIGILVNGELEFTRIVSVGAGKLADFFGKTGAAELKSGKMEEFQAKVHGLIAALARELSASIDFFETKNEAKVTEIVVSGGAARSQFVLQSLEAELEIPCETWTPARCRGLALPEGPQLAVAIGLGLGALDPNLVRINLLAEEQEAAEMRRRDPVRRGVWVAACAVLLMFLWSGYLGLKLWSADSELKLHELEIQTLQKNSSQAIATAKSARDIGRTLDVIKQQATNRFLFAPTLNALQFTTVREIQFHRLKIEQNLATELAVKPVVEEGKADVAGKPATVTEKVVLFIQGKDYDDPQAIDRLVQTIAEHAYFKGNLRHTDPVLLRELQPRQVDPSDPNKTMQLFGIECSFAERIFKDE